MMKYTDAGADGEDAAGDGGKKRPHRAAAGHFGFMRRPGACLKRKYPSGIPLCAIIWKGKKRCDEKRNH